MKETVIINGIEKEIPIKVSLDIEKIDEIITPEMIEFYVKDKPSWREFPINREGVRIWQCDNKEDFVQITIPFNQEFSDYKYSLYRCVKNISFLENNSEIDALKNIVNNWNLR